MKNIYLSKFLPLLLLFWTFLSCASTAEENKNPPLRVDIRGEIDRVTIYWRLHTRLNIVGIYDTQNKSGPDVLTAGDQNTTEQIAKVYTQSEEVQVPAVKFYTADVDQGMDFILAPKGVGTWTVTLIRGNRIVKSFSMETTTAIPLFFHYEFNEIEE